MKYSSSISNFLWDSDDVIISSKYISKSYWSFSGNFLYFEEIMTSLESVLHQKKPFWMRFFIFYVAPETGGKILYFKRHDLTIW